jgi:hypothetical protein
MECRFIHSLLVVIAVRVRVPNDFLKLIQLMHIQLVPRSELTAPQPLQVPQAGTAISRNPQRIDDAANR